MGSATSKNPQQPGRKNLRTLDFRRTVSVDAIHTGGKGNVRSQDWIHHADLRQFQTGTLKRNKWVITTFVGYGKVGCESTNYWCRYRVTSMLFIIQEFSRLTMNNQNIFS